MTHHRTHRSPADLLMFSHPGHKAGGGEAAAGTMSSNISPYKKGGHPKAFMRNGRYCHAEGDTVGEMGVNPVNGYEYPGNPENKRRGGRAHHRRYHAEGDAVYADGDSVGYADGDTVGYADGDTVGYAEGDSVPYRRGGRTHRRRGHHLDGDSATYADGDSVGYADGDTVGYADGDTVGYAEGDSVPYRRGGRTHRRRGHHLDGDSATYAEGDSVEPKKRGGRARHRQHHSFGDFIKGVGNVASTVLPFLPMLLKDGGSAAYAEGDTVPYRRGGSSHRRRHHHLEGDEVYKSDGGELRRGGRARRHADGDEVALKRAMGGVGKLRKGMM